jgi:hypothetical protein
MHFATSFANNPRSSRQRLSSSPVIFSSAEYAFALKPLQRQKSLNSLLPLSFALFPLSLKLSDMLRRLIYALLVGLSQMGRRPRIYLIISPFPSRKRFRVYRD